MEGLLTWTAERVAKFPRDHKFTVGDRLLDICLDVMPVDSGAPWTGRGIQMDWNSVASSADGANLVTVGGYRYTSADSGAACTQRQ
jgi:hypothetical protein